MVKEWLRIHFFMTQQAFWTAVIHDAAQSVLLLTTNWLQRHWRTGESCLYSGLLDTRVGYYTISTTSAKIYGWKTDQIFPDLTLFFTRFSIMPRPTRQQLSRYSKTDLHKNIILWLFCQNYKEIAIEFLTFMHHAINIKNDHTIVPMYDSPCPVYSH